jgi:transcriptional regulator with XRE-family HTH domain
MPEPNEQLIAARKQKMWSQQKAAEEIGIDRKTYIRWEKGQHIPQPNTLELICNTFGMPAGELGFTDGIQISGNLAAITGREVVVSASSDDSFEEESRDWTTWLGVKLAQIVTMVERWRGQTAFCDELQIMVDQEIKMIDHELQLHQVEEQQAISRRQALITIAALATAEGTELVTEAAVEEFLPHCAASITFCWRLMKGKGFVAIVDILSTFVPRLATVALRPSKYQQVAARLAVQASIIQGILAMHQLNFTKREAHSGLLPAETPAPLTYEAVNLAMATLAGELSIEIIRDLLYQVHQRFLNMPEVQDEASFVPGNPIYERTKSAIGHSLEHVRELDNLG